MYKLLVSLLILAFLAVAFAEITFSIYDYGPRLEVVPTEDEAAVLFAKFKVDFDKSYATVEEEAKRFEYFKDHLKKIVEQNLNTDTATFGIFKFADLSPEEMHHMRTSGRAPQRMENYTEVPMNNSHRIEDTYYVDWRAYNIISPVKTQGCGDCYANVATEVVESAWAQAGGGLQVLSRQQILDCYVGDCQNGAFEGAPLNQMISNNYGMMDNEATYPYLARKQDQCYFQQAKATAQIRKVNVVMNENDIYNRVINGPVSTGIDMDTLVSYAGGILTSSNCKGDYIGHTVHIVGLLSANGIPVWLVKNSWGPNWGPYGGYAYIAAMQNACAIGADQCPPNHCMVGIWASVY